MQKEDWMGKHFSYFCNRECEYFPCHPTEHPENFNCLFCYCPLYNLGDKCGGNFTVLSNGVKDCSECLLPHMRENYGYVLEKQAEARVKKIKIKSGGSQYDQIIQSAQCENCAGTGRHVGFCHGRY